MTHTDNIGHLAQLQAVADSDVAVIRKKESTYQGSWKAAGGRSAWFMFRRNMDRLLKMMRPPDEVHGFSLPDLDECIAQAGASPSGDCTVYWTVAQYLRDAFVAEDIFVQIEQEPSGADGTVFAVLRDMRRYALLIEAEMVARGVARPEETESQWSRSTPDEKPAWTPEPERPGTPADGGHHENLAPWAVSGAWLGGRESVSQTHAHGGRVYDRWWKRQGRDLFVLEAAVPEDAGSPPGLVAHLYDTVGPFRIVRIASCPPGAREWFPGLRREANSMELDGLPEWQRGMYRWHNTTYKWIIEDRHEAWVRD